MDEGYARQLAVNFADQLDRESASAFAPVVEEKLQEIAWAVVGQFKDGDPVVVTVDNERLGFFWVPDGDELSFLSLGEARDLVLTTRWQEHEADAIEDGWTLEHPQFPAEIRIEHDSVRLDDRLDEILAPFLGA